ncbi:MAG: hypothetical protein NC319_02250 [Butyricicoccus sp.]|nr:hypothetical protein [Butyricicoccus sp.]
MKKVLVAMIVMLFGMILLGGVFGMIFGGGVEQSYIYPIYAGFTLLAGLVVGAAVVLYEELEKLREEIKSIREDAEKSKTE